MSDPRLNAVRARRTGATLVLAALWLAWVASVVVLASRADDGTQLRTDLQAHRVTGAG